MKCGAIRVEKLVKKITVVWNKGLSLLAARKQNIFPTSDINFTYSQLFIIVSLFLHLMNNMIPQLPVIVFHNRI